MLLLWLTLLVLTASPQLHRLLHDDADSLAHHCLVTQLQQQPSVAAFTPILLAGAPVFWLALDYRSDCVFLSSCDYCLPSSRAPPVVLPQKAVAG